MAIPSDENPPMFVKRDVYQKICPPDKTQRLSGQNKCLSRRQYLPKVWCLPAQNSEVCFQHREGCNVLPAQRPVLYKHTTRLI